jgi:serine/threonine-protein kinase
VFFLFIDLMVMPLVAGQFTSKTTVPELVGKTAQEAEEILSENSLNFRWNIEGKYSSVIPKGAVLIQMPLPGREVKEGRTVSLTVSKGLRELTIPDLRGKSVRQANISLNRMGLVVGSEISGAHASIPKGVVIRTEPPADQVVRVGDRVDIIVSAGEKSGKNILPNVVGVSLEQAQMSLDSAGFLVGEIERVSDKEHLPNTVLSQEPQASEYLESGSSINLKVVE